jgi:hypothetical protein
MKCAASVALQCMAVAILGVSEARAQLAPTEARLYFWEQAPGPLAPSEERMSASLFAATHSRYIGFNLALHYPAPGVAVKYLVSCRYIKPNGRTIGPIEIEFEVPPTWRRSDKAVARGWDEAGHWMPGTYRVQCSAGDVSLVERTFEMTANPPKLSGIRFFEKGTLGPSEEPPMYTTRFDAARSRYVAAEVTLALPATGDSKTPRPSGNYAVRCQYFLPGGRMLADPGLEFWIRADDSTSTSTTAVGWEDPGHWVPGSYRVICSESGRSLGEATFQVTTTPPDKTGRVDN